MIYNEHCIETMARLPVDHVNLIMTSPPYANQRKDTYGGISEDKYVDWFLPISKELHRILKPDGSFILNIKENVQNGQRSTYVYELVLALKKQGWLWTEEYCWHKKNAMPGKYPNRFRDGWERIYHFTKNRKFKMNQDEVMVPTSNSTIERASKISKKDRQRHTSKSGSGFARRRSVWAERKMVYPDNVLYLPTECCYVGHPAAYPVSIPSWFITLFSDVGDLIFDPFIGSGTTGKAAFDLDRKFIGSENDPKYFKVAQARTAQTKL